MEGKMEYRSGADEDLVDAANDALILRSLRSLHLLPGLTALAAARRACTRRRVLAGFAAHAALSQASDLLVLARFAERALGGGSRAALGAKAKGEVSDGSERSFRICVAEAFLLRKHKPTTDQSAPRPVY
jgi:hypothetical protein